MSGVPTFVKGFHDEDAVRRMEYRPLGNTGLQVSLMSLGGGPLGGLYGREGEAERVQVVREAVRQGVNYIDTAPWYGQGKSEALLGKALSEVPREAYYIGTKVGRYEWAVEDMFDFSAERVARSVDQSLKLLGLDYVDVIQVHDLEYAKSVDLIVNETLPALQKVVDQGKARHIGITGYPISALKEVLERSKVKVGVVLTYSRNTLIDDTLEEYMPFFQERGVGVISASAVAMGLLRAQDPPAWHPAPQGMKDAAKMAARHCQDRGHDLGRLAILHSASLPGASTHLLGCDNPSILHANIHTVTSTPSLQELRLIGEVRERFFSKLPRKEWEGGYLEEYWAQLKKAKAEKK